VYFPSKLSSAWQAMARINPIIMLIDLISLKLKKKQPLGQRLLPFSSNVR
jgi:hypothetical protein